MKRCMKRKMNLYSRLVDIFPSSHRQSLSFMSFIFSSSSGKIVSSTETYQILVENEIERIKRNRNSNNKKNEI